MLKTEISWFKVNRGNGDPITLISSTEIRSISTVNSIKIKALSKINCEFLSINNEETKADEITYLGVAISSENAIEKFSVF